jgi:hypothetical protein
MYKITIEQGNNVIAVWEFEHLSMTTHQSIVPEYSIRSNEAIGVKYAEQSLTLSAWNGVLHWRTSEACQLSEKTS